jgi:uncharacterized protein (TIGR03083 family)
MSSISRQYDPIPDLDVLRVDVAAAVEETAAAVRRMAAWMKKAGPSAPVPGLTWTVHDLAAHLSTDSYVLLARGQQSPFDLAGRHEQGAAAIEAKRHLPFDELVDTVQANAEAFLAAVDGRASTEPVAWHSGEPLTVGLLAATHLNEFVVHGIDAARAAGAKPVVTRRAAALGCAALLAEAVYVYLPPPTPVHARIEFRLRGAGALVWHFDGDRLSLEPPDAPGRIDAHVSADPVKFLLSGYGRRSQAWAFLTGGVVAWGRRPGVLSLLQRFENP